MQGAKIITGYGGEHSLFRFLHRERPAFRNEPASNRVTSHLERKIDTASHSLHARLRFKSFVQLTEKFHILLVLFVFRTLQREVGGKNVVRVEARPHLLQTQEALDEQPSADQQRQRESNFTNQEQAARTCPPMSFAAASAFFQCAGDVELRGLKRGDDAKENAGKRRDAESERQDAIINPDLFEPRCAFGQDRHQQIG